MTFKSWLRGRLLDLLQEPATPVAPPTSNPEPPPSSPTLNGRTTPATSGVELSPLQIIELMASMQRETMDTMRGMVMDILQGREQPPLTDQDQVSVSRTRWDPPDYDDPGTDDLPLGIQGIFAREDREETEFRTSHPEPELLRSQLARARAAAGMDPQGPSATSSLPGSIGLQPEDLHFP